MSWLSEFRKDIERSIKRWKKENKVHEKIIKKLHEHQEYLRMKIQALLQTDAQLAPKAAKRIAESIVKEIMDLAERILNDG